MKNTLKNIKVNGEYILLQAFPVKKEDFEKVGSIFLAKTAEEKLHQKEYVYVIKDFGSLFESSKFPDLQIGKLAIFSTGMAKNLPQGRGTAQYYIAAINPRDIFFVSEWNEEDQGPEPEFLRVQGITVVEPDSEEEEEDANKED